MKVITLWQPWASFIAMGWKKIETRTHNRFKNLAGQTIGIHAGKEWDYSWDQLAEDYLDASQQHETFDLQCEFEKNGFQRGQIICTAKVEKFRSLGPPDSQAALIGCGITQYDFRYGLFLTDVKLIKPIAVQGHQGAWNYNGEMFYL